MVFDTSCVNACHRPGQRPIPPCPQPPPPPPCAGVCAGMAVAQWLRCPGSMRHARGVKKLQAVGHVPQHTRLSAAANLVLAKSPNRGEAVGGIHLWHRAHSWIRPEAVRKRAERHGLHICTGMSVPVLSARAAGAGRCLGTVTPGTACARVCACADSQVHVSVRNGYSAPPHVQRQQQVGVAMCGRVPRSDSAGSSRAVPVPTNCSSQECHAVMSTWVELVLQSNDLGRRRCCSSCRVTRRVCARAAGRC